MKLFELFHIPRIVTRQLRYTIPDRYIMSRFQIFLPYDKLMTPLTIPDHLFATSPHAHTGNQTSPG